VKEWMKSVYVLMIFLFSKASSCTRLYPSMGLIIEYMLVD